MSRNKHGAIAPNYLLIQVIGQKKNGDLLRYQRTWDRVD